jgi:hypothetical protein
MPRRSAAAQDASTDTEALEGTSVAETPDTDVPEPNNTPFSFADLEAEDAPEEAVKGAGRPAAPIPPNIQSAVRMSYTNGTPKRFPAIPEDQIKPLVNLLRRAAETDKRGISIRTEETPSGVVVSFKAHDKRKNPGRAGKAGAAAKAAAENAEQNGDAQV